MKIASFGDWRIGIVVGDEIVDVTDALPKSLRDVPNQRLNWLIEHWADVKSGIDHIVQAGYRLPLAQIKLMAASPSPAHVFAAPANYRKHIGELGDRAVTNSRRTAREQGFFLKAPGSVCGADDVICLPVAPGRRFDHESELAVIIGKHAKNVSRADAMKCVFGYACLVDATMRIEKGVAEEERSMRKSFNSFTPLGPWIVTADEVVDPHRLRNQLWINGELRQEANTADMIVDIPELIELVSSVVALRPGDVIATGTPEGVGPFGPGDQLRIAIESVGEMTMDVVLADKAPRGFGIHQGSAT